MYDYNMKRMGKRKDRTFKTSDSGDCDEGVAHVGGKQWL